MTRRHALLALNLVPLGISLYLVRRFYAGQPAPDILSLRNLACLAALVLVSVIGYGNTIWRYIMALKREGAMVDERVVSERLMYINLISFFFPFGVLNYAAQLALVYRQNPLRLVGRAFLHDKLVFLTAIAGCFLLTYARLTPLLAAHLDVPGKLVTFSLMAGAAGVIALAGYLTFRRYLRFLLAQVAVFALLNSVIALLLAAYVGAPGSFYTYLEKLFAYSLAIVLPVSLGGVGPREAILLFQVDDAALRAAILNFCILWFVALALAAALLFVFKRQASALAVRNYQRWRRSATAGGEPVGTIAASSARKGAEP